MREYESIFVMEPGATDADVDVEVEKIRTIVGQESGEITEVQKWGRRKLAYEVKKQTEGVYTLVRFQAGNDSLLELNRRFRMNESLLRYLTVEYEGPFPGEMTSPPGHEDAETAEEGSETAAEGTAPVAEASAASEAPAGEAPASDEAAPGTDADAPQASTEDAAPGSEDEAPSEEKE